MCLIVMFNLSNSTVKTVLGFGAAVVGLRVLGNVMRSESFEAEGESPSSVIIPQVLSQHGYDDLDELPESLKDLLFDVFNAGADFGIRYGYGLSTIPTKESYVRAESFNAEKNGQEVHLIITPYDAGGYSTTYLFPNEKQAKQGVWDLVRDYMWEAQSEGESDFPEYDWEGEIDSAENKAVWDKKTKNMSIEKCIEYSGAYETYYQKIHLDLTKPFKFDGEYGDVTQLNSYIGFDSFEAESFNAEENMDDMKHHMDMRWKEFTSKDKRDMELMDMHYGHFNKVTKRHFKRGYEYGWKLAREKTPNGQPLYMVARAKDVITKSLRKDGFLVESGAYAGFDDSWRAYEGSE